MNREWSRKKIFESLQEKLLDDTPKVILIKGKWGSGKTFLWNEVSDSLSNESGDIISETIKGIKYVLGVISSVKLPKFFSFPYRTKKFFKDYYVKITNNKLCKAINDYWNNAANRDTKKYVYISLFGIKSLEELKIKILNSCGGYRKWGILSIFGNRLVPSLMLESLIESNLKNLIVCFDDLERKHSQLELKEVFGLIDYLKNRRACTCVVIVNDEEVDKEVDTISNFRDKLIDTEIVFNPSIKHNVNIVFKNKVSDAYINEVLIVFDIFESSNIRTMSRALDVINQLHPFLDVTDDRGVLGIISQIVKLTILRYEHGDKVDIKLIDKSNWLSLKMKESKEARLSDAESLLAKAEFYPHPLDIFITPILMGDIISKDEIDVAAKEWQANLALQENSQEKDVLMDLIWRGFTPSQDEVISRIDSLIKKHLNLFSPQDLEQYVGILENLKPDIVKSEIYSNYIELKSKSSNVEDLERLLKLPITYIEKEKINNQIDSALKNVPIIDVIDRLVGQGNGYNSEDFRYLNTHTEDELFAYFNDSTHVDSRREFDSLAHRLTNKHVDYQSELAEKLLSCAKKFSERSTLDNIRVKDAKMKLESFLDLQKKF